MVFGTNTIETILSLTCHIRPVPILERVSWQLWTLFQHWHSDSAANPHVIVVSLSWPWVKVDMDMKIDRAHNANMSHANPTKYSFIKIAPLSPLNWKVKLELGNQKGKLTHFNLWQSLQSSKKSFLSLKTFKNLFPMHLNMTRVRLASKRRFLSTGRVSQFR